MPGVKTSLSSLKNGFPLLERRVRRLAEFSGFSFQFALAVADELEDGHREVQLAFRRRWSEPLHADIGVLLRQAIKFSFCSQQ